MNWTHFARFLAKFWALMKVGGEGTDTLWPLVLAFRPSGTVIRSRFRH